MVISDRDGIRPKRSRVGVYDKNILCKDFDKLFGILDQHGKEKLLDASKVVAVHNGHRLMAKEYSSADSTIMENFLLSVLLRASWSGNDFF